MKNNLLNGRVFKSTGSWYKVQLNDGRFINCRVRGKFKLEDKKITNPVSVGDWVSVKEDDQHEGTGIITEISPRENYLIRKSVHKTAHGHMLAANINQAMLVVTIKNPRTSLGFIDRFLVSTEAFRIPTTLVINKIDLYNDRDQLFLNNLVDIYEQIGFQCLSISALHNTGVDAVKSILQGKTTLLAGHSGTGKSTLVNLIAPNVGQKVEAISSFADKGVHTTTFAEMFEIAPHTFLIDTPGIKELGLIDIGDHELSDYFPEMRALIGQCRFHNCSHTHEPKCAVIAAVEDEIIAPSRYYNYLSMLEDDDTRR
jgi:ribosome biogenesis GTPase